jgi:hypothetical protein
MDMVFVLTAVQTSLRHTVAHVTRKLCFGQLQKWTSCLKAITFTNKATTCTHLLRPSLNIDRNGSNCTHTVTDMDLTRNTWLMWHSSTSWQLKEHPVTNTAVSFYDQKVQMWKKEYNLFCLDHTKHGISKIQFIAVLKYKLVR